MSELSTDRISDTADIAKSASVGVYTGIGQRARVCEGAVVGADCIIGRGAYVGPRVWIGDRCQVQDHARLYEPAVVGDGAFIGPAVVLTNDLYPRSITPDGKLRVDDDRPVVGVVVRDGASIGARAVCVAPVIVGRWAMVAAGAVVTSDVPDFALMAGDPARQIGWVGRTGVRLVDVGDSWFICSRTGELYREEGGRLLEQLAR